MLIEDLDIPEEEHFQDTTDNLSDIMNKLDINQESDEEDEETDVEASSMENVNKERAIRRELSDIMKTKIT